MVVMTTVVMRVLSALKNVINGTDTRLDSTATRFAAISH